MIFVTEIENLCGQVEKNMKEEDICNHILKRLKEPVVLNDVSLRDKLKEYLKKNTNVLQIKINSRGP